MHPFEKQILPDRKGFEKDPFGYSALALYKWGIAKSVAGYSVDLSNPPAAEDFKNPVLWLTHAHAMSEAARIVIQNEPEMEHLPIFVKGVCDCQYCAIGLMLVGYSLEICLKAMLIMKMGVDVYTAEERKHRHHRLEALSAFVPELSKKDKAILQALTHFIKWAGRYPDPGVGLENNAEEIFALSERHQVAAKDLFCLASRVMKHSQSVAESL